MGMSELSGAVSDPNKVGRSVIMCFGILLASLRYGQESSESLLVW